MKLSRLFLSLASFTILFICVAPGWADKIPSKRPSDYGDQDSQVLLTTPSFSTITQDNVTLALDSVFCNSCTPGDPNNATNLEYFFAINLASGGTLSSLTFGPGFDTNSQAFAVVQFDNSIPGDPCNSGGTYICHVPISASNLDFSTVESALTCDGAGICTLNFTNFNFATLGNGTIILAATTPFGGLGILNDPTTGNPLTPSVTVNGKSSVAVPEPSSLWFALISVVVCLGLIVKGKRRVAALQIC
jgi:hypothetical protein